MNHEDNRAVAAGFRILADRLLLQNLGFTAEQSMKSEGRLEDPYHQGAADAIEIVVQTLRRTADRVEGAAGTA